MQRPAAGQDLASPTEPERHPWHERFLLFLRAHKGWAIAATAAAVVLMVFSVPALLNRFAPNNNLVSMGIQREQMERQLAELNRQTLSSGTIPGLDVTLNPTNLLRDGGEFKQVEVIKGVRILNFTFVLPNAQQNKYTVIARKIDGDELFSVSDLSPKVNGTPNMFLRIPAEFLPPNDYQFEAKGTAADGSSTSVAIYNLRVVNPASQP